MVGLGEKDDEILKVIKDLDTYAIDLLTIGQYLSPSIGHLPVKDLHRKNLTITKILLKI